MTKHSKFYISLLIAILFGVTALISVGFTALNQNLNIAVDIDYEEDSYLLYNVLKKEVRLGTYAKEYTGEHEDSFTEEATHSIYYWHPTSDDDANIILDKWNVIFGNFCWQMIRTTDTGGVKLIYNGTPASGKCKRSGTGQQIGTSSFNATTSSPADVGYMYNTRYEFNVKSSTRIDVLTNTSMTDSNNYYYGTGVTYSAGTYTLTGITQATWTNTYSSSSGLYTCNSTTDTTCSTVYYIVGGVSRNMYGFEMTDGNLLNDYNTSIVFGTNYTESNGAFTLNNTTTVSKADWYSNYSTYKDYYTCGDTNTTCTDMEYVASSYKSYYNVLLLPNNYIYAKDFSYDNGTATYTLGSDRYETWNMTDTDKSNLARHHYTCFNQTGQCQTLSYVYYAASPSDGRYIYYINLTGGKSVDDALNEMLNNDNVNTTDSIIKTYIDNWYSNNMTNYTSYLEDIIFCNNRKPSSRYGWDPNGGSVKDDMRFGVSLSCTNDTDKFSVSNNKAKITYPVGLATYRDINLLAYTGGNNSLVKTGVDYWLSSPMDFNYFGSFIFKGDRVSGTGSGSMPSASLGVRPVVSLKPGTKYVSGTGSKDDPYRLE